MPEDTTPPVDDPFRSLTAMADKIDECVEPDPTALELALLDDDNQPIPGARYHVELPDGTVRDGEFGADGSARLEGLTVSEDEVVSRLTVETTESGDEIYTLLLVPQGGGEQPPPPPVEVVDDPLEGVDVPWDPY